MKETVFLSSILALLLFSTPAAAALDWNDILDGLSQLPGAQDTIRTALDKFVDEALNTINSNNFIYDSAKSYVDGLMAKGGYAGQAPTTNPKVVSDVKSKMTSSDKAKVAESEQMLTLTSGLITILDWLDQHPQLMNQLTDMVGKLTDIKVTIIQKKEEDKSILGFISKALPFLGALL